MDGWMDGTDNPPMHAILLSSRLGSNDFSFPVYSFSSAISSCEKQGQWRMAIDLLDQMEKEGIARTAIAYNAAISACEVRPRIVFLFIYIHLAFSRAEKVGNILPM
jgi:pentatricopeptide repeat protein